MLTCSYPSGQELHKGLQRYAGEARSAFVFVLTTDQSPRCHVQRPLGSIGDSDERGRSVDIQPVRPHDVQSGLTCRGDFVEVMEMLDKRLNDKGKNWRHVFKVRLVKRLGV